MLAPLCSNQSDNLSGFFFLKRNLHCTMRSTWPRRFYNDNIVCTAFILWNIHVEHLTCQTLTNIDSVAKDQNKTT